MSDKLAEQAAQAMWVDDAASRWLGIEMAEVTTGHATMTLEVQPHHCNGHGTLHGGVTFMLADTAFALACNSRGQRTVAQAASINFLAPGQAGDTLTATAREVQLRGKSGLYDITVTRQTGEVIAEFRGQSRAVPGRRFEGDGA